MSNHYHLVLETPEANLSRGMRQLNGVYTQSSNRRHDRTGHLFGGRFKAILVDKESYYLELARYVVLNPLRAGMVEHPGDWPWSSYRATAGEAAAAPWLAVEALLECFGRRQAAARRRYRQFILDGVGHAAIWSALRQQIYLGDADFVARMQAAARAPGDRRPFRPAPERGRAHRAGAPGVIRRPRRGEQFKTRPRIDSGSGLFSCVAGRRR